MRRLFLLLLPAALLGGQARYARLGEFEGTVEVQLTAADPWSAAQRNLPLLESSWLRTAADGKVEIEFDDGGVLRLGPDSLVELSDLGRLSTGQRITLLALDRGVAYFTGQADAHDSLTLAAPGAQVTVRRGARIRLEAAADWSQASVIEGVVRFSSPAAEFDLNEGQSARVEPARTARFFLYREIAEAPTDRWSEARDKYLASAVSGPRAPVAYGLADIDAGGEWMDTRELGVVWKPKVAEDWVPYRAGRWRWYDALGYAWISDEPWGWTPYHYGRFLRHESLGWIWVPSKSSVFKPGDVYWLRGAKIAGWGPLAPGEEWTPVAAPRQFLNVNTTWADFLPEARAIDPAGFAARPKEPLGAAAFALAPPSPTFLASRLDAVRPALRVGGVKVAPVLPGVTYQSPSEAGPISSTGSVDPQQPVATVTNPGGYETPVVVVQPPPPPPQVVEYPVPVYTGIVVVNPPERGDHGDRRRGDRGRRPSHEQSSSSPPAAQPSKPAEAPAKTIVKHDSERHTPAQHAAAPARSESTPRQAQAPAARTEARREHQERAAPSREKPAEKHERPAEKKEEKEKPADSSPSSSVVRRR
jgi:hypothetical protein